MCSLFMCKGSEGTRSTPIQGQVDTGNSTLVFTDTMKTPPGNFPLCHGKKHEEVRSTDLTSTPPLCRFFCTFSLLDLPFRYTVFLGPRDKVNDTLFDVTLS